MNHTKRNILEAEAVRAILKDNAKKVEDCLTQSLTTQVPHLRAAMEYSLQAGGKRLRPILCARVASLFGFSEEKSLPFAIVLEYIHTYSLIHDDLPAMDDDDMRRGKPSCHKAFDEATAILAGCGLLTDAFTLMVDSANKANISPKATLKAIKIISEAAGSIGMVGGQALDMRYTNNSKPEDISQDDLLHMYSLKTGALFKASCLSGAVISGAFCDNAAPKEVYDAIEDYAFYLGRAFQIVDDILDVTQDSETLGKPAGSDTDMNKQTILSYLSLEEAKLYALELSQKAIEALDLDYFEEGNTEEAAFLRGLASLLANRIS